MFSSDRPMHQPTSATPNEPAPHSKPKKNRWLAWVLVLFVCGILMIPLLLPTMPPSGMPPGMGPGGPPTQGAGANRKGMKAFGPPSAVFAATDNSTPVTAAKVQSGNMDIFLDALGTVTPLATVNVYSQVSGRVLAVNYREGQMVHKGQVLVEIDPRPTEAQLQQAQGSLARDRALLDQARVNLRRYQEALKERAIAEQTVFDQSATVRQYEGTVANDEGQVKYYEVQLSYSHIIAPISGRIGLRLVDTGNTIFSGSSTTIATITQLNPITVVFSVAEDHLPKIQQKTRPSQAALTVAIYDRSQSNRLTTGKLLTLDNQVDTSTGTVRLRAQFDNASASLYPNQFVNARLQVDTLQNAKLVPTGAVQYNGQQAFVYLVKQDSSVALRNITVLNTEGGQSAIEGLTTGDTVVTSNFDRLTDGAKVTVGSGQPSMMGPA
ncbi:efflux RND transporter periplasmic adaptor subunit [Terriglobus saanensis]|uniref:Efflux transporter, RND family, MFP subunit n=1 Tax=Terriglobus saanensis (strain ATCC BAA-1853 / DSM 23119 / SP1PR4) TaxID=401053 RepID=E8V1V6_TERSS|nr:efflux RND transporter periplasmic adaptor subunit [Terriglobus saanensis]ADV83444.1 efflux transporter, RND family, MFP subunit [Terriglobus saanensis SP1PR4]